MKAAIKIYSAKYVFFNLIIFTKLCSFLATFFKVFMKKLILRNILPATLLTK